MSLLALTLAAAPRAGIAAGAPADVAREINWTAAAATAVVASLQAKINGATATAADLDPAARHAAFAAAYQRLAGRTPEAVDDPTLREILVAMHRANEDVLARFRGDILRGGQDAFVPAFFRAQLFDRFNAEAAGRYRAVVTTRSRELINPESAIERLLDDAAIVADMRNVLEAGRAEPELRAIGTRTVGYWPMTITEPCMTCHRRNGLRQELGQFGGATIVVVGR